LKPGDKKRIYITLSDKIKDIATNIPQELVVGDEIDLKVTAIGYHSSKALDNSEYSLEISNKNVLEYRSGKLIAKNPGTAIVNVKYQNKVSVRQVVNVYYTLLQISSTPSDADIYIDGDYIGKTPEIVPVKELKYSVSIRLSKTGYDDVQRTVYLTKGDRKTINLSLAPKPHALYLHMPDELKLGNSLSRSNIRIEMEYENGSKKYLSFGDVNIKVSGSLSLHSGRIYAKEVGKGYVTVSYKGLSTTKTVYVYKPIKIISDPPGVEVYTPYDGYTLISIHEGKYLGKTPLTLKLLKTSQKIILKKEPYVSKTIYVYPNQSEVHAVLSLPLENKVKPLLDKGKISEIAKLIKNTPGYTINETEEKNIINAVKDFDESKVNRVSCKTTGGKLFKEYALRYIRQLKSSIESMNTKKTAELLQGLRPNVAKELLRKEKPWAWAFKKAFEEDYTRYNYNHEFYPYLKGLSALLSNNGKLQGAYLKKGPILPEPFGFGTRFFDVFISDSPPPYFVDSTLLGGGHYEEKRGTIYIRQTYSSDYNKLFVFDIAYLRFLKLNGAPFYIDIRTGLGEILGISPENVIMGGYLPVELSIVKPITSNKEDPLPFISVVFRAGTQLIPLENSKTFFKLETGVSIFGFSINFGRAYLPDDTRDYMYFGLFDVAVEKIGLWAAEVK
ncbi:MAG: PEGA domain-containing protein, partial [Thermotogaceae bacterium]|nr:PEGA domain-containing protein [Thermotogaceae bacterium]